MKTTLTTLLWLLLNPSDSLRELAFDVHQTNGRPGKFEKPMVARIISDFWQGFPKMDYRLRFV